MKLKFSYLLLILLPFASHSQTDFLNHKKYWFYHYRLLNDFMVKGDCKGCSIPMNERFENNSPVGRWGDGTIVLAEYMSLLATEYELLKRNNQPTDTTIQELFYALKTFNRLDYNAESAFGGTNSQNGFFIRDDVPSTFITDHPRLANGTTSNKHLDTIYSDYAPPWYGNTRDKEMSHDQVWSLFMGFSLVSKFVDPGTNYQNFEVNEITHNTDLRQEAIDITARIINYLKSKNWEIKNPVTNNIVFRGHQVKELSYGAAEAACYIENQFSMNTFSPFTSPPNILPIRGCDGYHDTYSKSEATVWNLLRLGVPIYATFSYDAYKPALLATIGHSWWSDVNIPPYVNQTRTYVESACIAGDWQHVPLLRQVLHGGGNSILESFYENIINSAPCEGPSCFWNSGGACSTFEWSSSNRLRNPDERNGGSADGEYNGIDYMLYYNLYNIINPSTIPYVNFMDSRITFPIPIGNPLMGTTANPLTIEAFNTIEATNTVNSNADATYRAGKSIHFGPDFHVVAGANFHAYIDPFECATDGEYRSVSTTNTTNNNAVAYAGNTTFANYPSTVPQYIREENVLTAENTIVNKNNSIEIKIIPNPSNGIFSIESNSNENSAFQIKLYDILGNLVSNLSMTENLLNINLTNQSKGVYYVEIKNDNGYYKTEKIIVQ
ncbi:MAG: T9SS type A sorting domain-containing protein [Bacteroidetes bacterium]|nr:T9SS type A sorting domain-containing protein [Bacteroidota bacterium]